MKVKHRATGGKKRVINRIIKMGVHLRDWSEILKVSFPEESIYSIGWYIRYLQNQSRLMMWSMKE